MADGHGGGQVGELKRRIAELEARYAALELRHRQMAAAHEETCGARSRQQEQLRLAEVIIDKSPVILFRRLAGENPRLVYVSPNISRFGYTPEDFISERITFRDIVHPEDSERLSEEIRAYTEADAEQYTQHYRVMTAAGEVRWVEDQTSVVRDDKGRKIFHQGILSDVTERRLAEEKLRRSEEKHRRIIETAGEGFLMMDAALRIIDVNEAYCRMLGYRREELLGKTPMDLATDSFGAFMQAHRERLLAADYRKFEGTLVAKDGRVVPVLIHGNTLRDDRGRQIGNVAFVADLSEQKRALDLAGLVQKSLSPGRAPAVEGLDIAGRSDSCDEVGGDYFDFLCAPEYPGDTLKVVVGDIAGHGVEAALLMTSARAFIRSRASQPGTPAQIVSSMNRTMARDMKDTGHFMTLFLLEIDPRRRSLQWVRAGHEPAQLYLPAADRFEELVGRGTALGVAEQSAYAESALDGLPPGTVLAVGTDGIWETTDGRGRPFGKARFRDAIRHHAADRAEGILGAVFDELHRFSGGKPPEDDVTLVVLKLN